MSQSQMIGADVGALRELAGKMQAAAIELDTVRVQVRSRLHASPWGGGDADTFRNAWDGPHTRQLQQTCEGLRRMAGELQRNADEQEEASAAGGTASAGASPAVGRGGGEADPVFRRVLDGLQHLVNAGGLLADGAKHWLGPDHPVGKFGRIGGRYLGPVGWAFDAWEVVHGTNTLDPFEFAHGGIGLAIAGLTLFPATAPLGAAAGVVWATSNIAYQYNDGFKRFVDGALRPLHELDDYWLGPLRDHVQDHPIIVPIPTPFGPIPFPIGPVDELARDIGDAAVDVAQGAVAVAAEGASTVVEGVAGAVATGAQAVAGVAGAVEDGAQAVADGANAVSDAADEVIDNLTAPLLQLNPF